MNRLVLLAVLLAAQSSFAAISVQEWKNPACKEGQKCGVKAFRIYDKQHNNGRIAGATMSGEIETSDPDALKKYAIIQYIRGCVYHIDKAGKKSVARRNFFGNDNAIFQHKTWELDSGDDADPVYMSYYKKGFDELRGFEIPRNVRYVNDNPLKTENIAYWAGKATNLKEPGSIYVADFPTGSSIGEKGALTISSLQFKACVYDVSKIPLVVREPKTMFAGALACFDWSSNYGFSKAQKKLVKRTNLDPFCLKK